MSKKFFIEYTEVYFTRRWKMKHQILLGLLMIAGTLMPATTNGKIRTELVFEETHRSATASNDKEYEALAKKNKEVALDEESRSYINYDLWGHRPEDKNAINKLKNNPFSEGTCRLLESEVKDQFRYRNYYIFTGKLEGKEKYFDKNSARAGDCKCKFSMTGAENSMHPKNTCYIPIYYKSLIYNGK